MGKYNITENKSDSVKFRAMVEFNDKPAQYWEHDSTDPKEISMALEAVANEDLAVNVSKSNISITLNKGQVVVPTEKLV